MDTPMRVAATPEPPYYAVIFTSRRNERDPAGYAEASTRMVELASGMPGFLGVESVRDTEGFGITVSYWADEDAIAGWKAHAEHAIIRERGRRSWYGQFEVRVARVERAYGMAQRA